MNDSQTTRLLALVCLLSLLSSVGMALPYPVITPLFVTGPADGFTTFAGLPREWLLGLALAANPVGLLLGSFWLGPLSDHHGRKRVLAASLVVGIAGNALSAWAVAERNYLLFVLGRLIAGLCEGNIAIARALLADAHAHIDRTRAFAWLNAFAYAGWLLGPLLGGWSVRWGLAAPFALAAALQLPALLLAWATLPADDPAAAHAHRARASTQQSTWALLHSEAGLRSIALCHIGFTLGVNAVYEYAPLWLVQRVGLDIAGISWVIAAQCAVMVAASALATQCLRWLKQQAPALNAPLTLAAALAAAVALGLAVLAIGQKHTGLAALLLMGLPLALYNAVLPTYLAERYAHLGQGRVMGMMSTWFCLSTVTISLIGGVLGWLDVRWTMALGGAMCLLAALRMRMRKSA